MPWCPVCKNEYVEGKTHCPDCDVDLVDELPKEEPEEMPETELPDEEELADIAARRASAAQMNTYTSARSRQSETKSSAWTFLVVGCAGFIVITLAFIGVVHLPFNTFSLAVMEAVFVIFLLIAAVSFKNASKLAGEVSREDDLKERIEAWAKEHLDASALSADIEDGTPEEMRYFLISEQIRKALMTAFPEVDDAYAEELTENYYNELFPDR